jgi:hypothetical protein
MRCFHLYTIAYAVFINLIIYMTHCRSVIYKESHIKLFVCYAVINVYARARVYVVHEIKNICVYIYIYEFYRKPHI